MEEELTKEMEEELEKEMEEETVRRLENIANHAVHIFGESPFIMSLDDGIAIKEAIKSLKAWNKINAKIQSIKTMKEQELLTAGDLITAYILQGEITMLTILKKFIKEQRDEK